MRSYVRCYKQFYQRRVRNIIYQNFLFRTTKWKTSVDEAATFLDGGKIPCLLVENKVDLLEDAEAEDPSLQDFAQQNEFCGCFRTSAKTGTNIAESMDFLIKTIIKRMEDMSSKGNEVFTTERKSVALDPEKHNQTATAQRKKDNGGCC